MAGWLRLVEVDLNGVIVLDKPAGWTSHDAVNKVRRLTQQTKVGHLGTLDPMATGVLPLVVGRATRLAQFVTTGRKVYDAVVRFGFSTDTYDCEGESTSEAREITLDEAQVRSWCAAKRGTYAQMPPAVSAKKVNGVPAYKLARQNKPVELKAVEVTIEEMTLLECRTSEISVRVVCSGGTYVRSIAHELGQTAGCGAHLGGLRRLESCGFKVDEATTMDALTSLAASEGLGGVVKPAASLLPQFPAVRVDEDTVAHIRQGRTFRMSPFVASTMAPMVRAIADNGELIAIGEARMPLVYQPIVVL